MAPLADNLTDRLWLDYITGSFTTSRQHTVMLRFGGNISSPAVAMARFEDVLDAMEPSFFREGWRFTSARHAGIGAAFSVPVSLTTGLQAWVGTFSGVYSGRMEAVEDSYPFRSNTTGRRGNFSLYRAQSDTNATFRYSMVSEHLAALVQAASDGLFRVIDGSAPTFYSYVNQNYNSYWEREIRP